MLCDDVDDVELSLLYCDGVLVRVRRDSVLRVEACDRARAAQQGGCRDEHVTGCWCVSGRIYGVDDWILG